MKTKIGINGFGRIGKHVLKIALERDDLEVVAINSTSGPEKHAHIFKYDSMYGIYPKDVSADKETLYVGDKKIKFTAFRNPEEIPWKELGVEIVIESTGIFNNREDAFKHVKAGAKKVVLSAPGKNVDGTFVMGVNESTYDPEKHEIVSNASCTTNCLGPVVKVLNDSFGIEEGLMTTIHAYTNDQQLLDKPHKKDPRRARSAALSMIPTTTGAAKAIGLVIPEMAGKLNGMAVRVPTPVVSLVDLVVNLKKEASVEEVNAAMKKASENELKGILGFSELPLVSKDFTGDYRSSILDADLTSKVGDKMVKVVSWYDNEWGYSARVVDLVGYIAERL
ncbi:MAG: type I glyceraldehyde-3-phosphate dehydrogenase [Clostridiales bacterium]|nr:MAG: type I glyceraldehyde-3-phosphate dehydrogenase [Clostridiales bacterium]